MNNNTSITSSTVDFVRPVEAIVYAITAVGFLDTHSPMTPRLVWATCCNSNVDVELIGICQWRVHTLYWTVDVTVSYHSSFHPEHLGTVPARHTGSFGEGRRIVGKYYNTWLLCLDTRKLWYRKRQKTYVTKRAFVYVQTTTYCASENMLVQIISSFMYVRHPRISSEPSKQWVMPSQYWCPWIHGPNPHGTSLSELQAVGKSHEQSYTAHTMALDMSPWYFFKCISGWLTTIALVGVIGALSHGVTHSLLVYTGSIRA